MNTKINDYRKIVLEKARDKYSRIEKAETKKDAESRVLKLRRKGYYFAIAIKEKNGWCILIE